MIAKRWTSSLMPSEWVKKPFLVGGLGLTVGVSLWELMVPDPGAFLGAATWGAIALGTGAWWLTRRDTSLNFSDPPLPDVIDHATVDTALVNAKQSLEQFVTEVAASPQSASYAEAIALLQQRYQTLTQSLDRHSLRCTVIGTKGVGKTALVDYLSNYSWATQSADRPAVSISFDDTDRSSAIDSAAAAASSAAIAVVPELQQADLVLFVTEGDVTASELQAIRSLIDQRFEVIVVFNKRDRHLPEVQQTIIQKLQERLCPPLETTAIVSTAAIATDIKVRQHQLDGTVEERIDQNPVQIEALTGHVQQVLDRGAEPLVLPTTLRQVHQFQRDIQQQWNHLRRDRARPVLEKYQWIAAATAFANPLPTLDLVATGAINAQLVADLGQLYDQPFTLNQAKVTTSTLAELMVKLGLVELTTQAIAPLLKTHTLTFAAGGAVQGLSAAYLTRVAGLSVVQYLEEQCVAQAVGAGVQSQQDASADWNLDRLGQIMQQVFQTYQRGNFLQTLVDQGIKRFSDRFAGPSQTTTATATATH